MPKYVFALKEVWEQDVFVVADSEEEARELLADGEYTNYEAEFAYDCMLEDYIPGYKTEMIRVED